MFSQFVRTALKLNVLGNHLNCDVTKHVDAAKNDKF